MVSQTADGVIRILDLLPHPEGGYYTEIYRDRPQSGRGVGTAIYFLLRSDQVSHWHRIDATEIFHYYDGLPLEIRLWRPGQTVERAILGPNLASGQRPTVIITPGTWQAARPLAASEGVDYSLVGCTVAPAFEFSGFELAPAGWEPTAV